MKIIRKILGVIRLIFVVQWAMLSISTSLIIQIFHKKLALSMTYGFFAGPVLFFTGMRVKIFNRERINRKNTYIILMNHRSFWDIPLAYYVTRISIRFVAKKELKKTPFIGWYVRYTDMIFIDRSNKERAYESLKEAGRLIRGGKTVLMYPEGSRSKKPSAEMSQFKKGSFHLAKEAKVDILPIVHFDTARVVPSNSMMITPGKVYVQIGEPIKASEYENWSIEEFRENLQKRMKSLHADVKQKFLTENSKN